MYLYAISLGVQIVGEVSESLEFNEIHSEPVGGM